MIKAVIFDLFSINDAEALFESLVVLRSQDFLLSLICAPDVRGTLSPYVEDIVITPDTDPINVASLLGVSPSECIFVGCSADGLKGARSAGMQTVFYDVSDIPLDSRLEIMRYADRSVEHDSDLYSLNEGELFLTEVSPAYEDQIEAFKRECLEFDADNEDLLAGCYLLDDHSAAEWIRICALRRSADTCKSVGSDVPSHSFLAVRRSDLRVVGIIDLRHHIDHPILGTWGGHCGYTVRPSERGKGYASEMLRLNIARARKMGITKMLITCNSTNIGSEKVIVRNGGEFERCIEVDGATLKRFWICV